MRAFRVALLATSLSMCMGAVYAAESTDDNRPEAATQSQGQPPAADQTQGVGEAVPPGAAAEERTSRAGEPGPGVRPGSNEGGSDRETPSDMPTATPGTAENLDDSAAGSAQDATPAPR